MDFSNYVLGRRAPSDWKHVEKYPYAALQVGTVANVNRELKLLGNRALHDQGREGACVGFGASMAMGILNRKRYDSRWLWNEAKKIDQWADTNPGDDNGTSVRAAFDVLRTQGHVRLQKGRAFLPDLKEGVAANRWARSVDEMRSCIASGTPVVIGVDWFANFDRPQRDAAKGNRYTLPVPAFFGWQRGGHCVCVYGALDKYDSFCIVNSWGMAYPLALLPYKSMERLLMWGGEATLFTDR
jgi:hypothetical protein